MSGSFRHRLRYFPDEVLIPLTSKIPADLGREIYYELGQIFLSLVDKIYAIEETNLIAQEKQLRDAGEIEINIQSTMHLRGTGRSAARRFSHQSRCRPASAHSSTRTTSRPTAPHEGGP